MPTGSRDLVALAYLPPQAAIAKLRAVQEFEAANILETQAGAEETALTFGVGDSLRGLFGSQTPPYFLPTDVVGYVPPRPLPGICDIIDVASVTPDRSLRNTRISVTLQRLRTYKYPGSGKHTILFDFTTQNYVEGRAEDVHYSVSAGAYDDGFASIRNFPMFRGLCLGTQGLSLCCTTMNVSSAGDANLLKFLHAGVLQTGLKLVSTVQPAIGILSDMAEGLASYLNERDTNVVVQEVKLGLDFSDLAFGARLACGSYIAVQAEASEWGDWQAWGYDSSSGQLVRRGDPTAAVPHNYLVFGIDRYVDG